MLKEKLIHILDHSVLTHLQSKYFIFSIVLLGLWIAIPAVAVLTKKARASSIRWGNLVTAFVMRVIVGVGVLLAIYQWSLRTPSALLRDTLLTGLIVDASTSFNKIEHRERVLDLLKKFSKLKICFFGAHSSVVRMEGDAKPLMDQHFGVQRNSKFSTIEECVLELKKLEVPLERMIVYTDSRLKWDSMGNSLPLQWVHERATTNQEDVAVRLLSEDQLFFEGTHNSVTIQVRIEGVSGSIHLSVSSPQALLKTIPVDVPRDGQWHDVNVSFSEQDTLSLKKGMPLLFQLPKTAVDQSTADNEVVLFPVWAPHKIKVLHVAGSPSTDSYYLRRWLKAQPNFEVISFYILKDYTDDNSISEKELSLIPFPVDKLFDSEMDKFNVVILQNFQWSAFLNGKFVQRIKSFVQDTGKGMMLIGGPRSFKPVDLQMQDVQNLLPFRMESRGMWNDKPTYIDVIRKDVSGSNVRNRPLNKWVWSNQFPLDESLKMRRQITQTPDVEGYHDLQLNAAAVPWAGITYDTADTPRWLMASKESGGGRVLMLLTDQLHRWILEASDLNLGDLYGQFFEKAIGWLSFYTPQLQRPFVQTPFIYKDDVFHLIRPSIQAECAGNIEKIPDFSWRPKSFDTGFCMLTHESQKHEAQWVYLHGAWEEDVLQSPPIEQLQKKLDGVGARLHIQPTEQQWLDLVMGAATKERTQNFDIKPLWRTEWLLSFLFALMCVEWFLRRRSGLL